MARRPTRRGTQFSEIDPVDALSGNAGNRFDVVGGGVLYASTDIEGCYREVLARLAMSAGPDRSRAPVLTAPSVATSCGVGVSSDRTGEARDAGVRFRPRHDPKGCYREVPRSTGYKRGT